MARALTYLAAMSWMIWVILGVYAHYSLHSEDAHTLIGDPFSKCSWFMVEDSQNFFMGYSEDDLWVVAANCQARVTEGI